MLLHGGYPKYDSYTRILIVLTNLTRFPANSKLNNPSEDLSGNFYSLFRSRSPFYSSKYLIHRIQYWSAHKQRIKIFAWERVV